MEQSVCLRCLRRLPPCRTGRLLTEGSGARNQSAQSVAVAVRQQIEATENDEQYEVPRDEFEATCDAFPIAPAPTWTILDWIRWQSSHDDDWSGFPPPSTATCEIRP